MGVEEKKRKPKGGSELEGVGGEEKEDEGGGGQVYMEAGREDVIVTVEDESGWS